MKYRDFDTDKNQEEKLEKFYGILAEYNKKVNLTAISGREDFIIKHVWDSLAGEKYFGRGARVAEVGSGGGFPSIPLKICRPDLEFTLFESVGKKCAFLKYAADELGLEEVAVENMRAEDAGRGVHRERYDACCARAVARLNTLLEYCAPLVKVGGIFVAYKGDAAEEVKEAERALSLLGARLLSAREEQTEAGTRTVVVCEKIKHTPPAYPRGRGKERSSPL